ncbi:MAG TPA: hypothetical protein VFX97_01605 [Pyrinomonadaceae bacterium]|nr:hypothetical protein [Pyrinomonadaceae bacterium]
MTDGSSAFSTSDLLAAATQTLATGGYQQIQKFPDWDTSSSRLFEDPYNIVGVVVYATCRELLDEWTDRQGSLVDVISGEVGRIESKSWDGYLILLTPSILTSESAEIDEIRRDTTRIRKFVATGSDLQQSSDVERVLRSLLPLSDERNLIPQESALDLLPELLANQGISEHVTQILVNAFAEQLPLLEQLHERTDE